MHIELSSGQTVEVRERVTSGQRKRYYEAIENAREVQAEIPVLKMGPDGQPERDEDGNPIILRDDEGRTIYETRMIVPVAATFDTLDVFMGMLVEGWSFDLPLPSSGPVNADGTPRNVFDDLDIDDYDELSAKVKPLVDKLRPSFKTDPDPGSPTEPSSE